MSVFIDGMLDELDWHVRALEREVSWLKEEEVSWPGDQNLGRIHDVVGFRRQISLRRQIADLAALRLQLVSSADAAPSYLTQTGRPVTLSARVA